LGCDSDSYGPHKHTRSHSTVEISFSLDAAIILAGAIIKLNPYPVPWSELSLADEADDSGAAIAEPDNLPDR
jgi:hypothetical protein